MTQLMSYALACGFDEKFALPAAVALHSVSVHWSGSTRLDVYIIDSGVTPQSRSRIEESVLSSRIRLHWRPIDVESFLGLPVFAGRTHHLYHRFAIGDILPEGIDRAIWLDMDVFVLSCLSALGEIDLGGQPLAAVQDMAIPRVSSPMGLGEFEKLGLSADAPYFNSGIMVIDLKLWRKEETGSRLMHYAASNARRIRLFDQHAFNALYAGRWLALDPRWNVIASLFGHRYLGGPDLRERSDPGISGTPWVLHFAGAFKPWKIPLRGPAFDRYREVLREIPLPVHEPGWYDRSLAIYFHYFRQLLYPLERLCWILRHRFSRA